MWKGEPDLILNIEELTNFELEWSWKDYVCDSNVIWYNGYDVGVN